MGCKIRKLIQKFPKIITFQSSERIGKLNDIVAEITKMVSKIDSIIRISLKNQIFRKKKHLLKNLSYRNVAFISSLLSLRTQIDAKFPRIPKVATNGMKNPSTIFDTLRTSDIVTDVRWVSSSKISGKWIKV